MRKKIMTIILSVAMTMTLLVGCGNDSGNTPAPEQNVEGESESPAQTPADEEDNAEVGGEQAETKRNCTSAFRKPGRYVFPGFS